MRRGAIASVASGVSMPTMLAPASKSKDRELYSANRSPTTPSTHISERPQTAFQKMVTVSVGEWRECGNDRKEIVNRSRRPLSSTARRKRSVNESGRRERLTSERVRAMFCHSSGAWTESRRNDGSPTRHCTLSSLARRILSGGIGGLTNAVIRATVIL